MVCNTFPILREISFMREHRQKPLVMLSGFWPFKGIGGFSDSVKKGKFVKKPFFQIMLNEVLKICEICHLLM